MLKRFKKSLRKSQTDAEDILWYQLRNRNFKNHKFRRQHILCGYIVDFVCLEEKLVIELDEGQHAEKIEYDSARTLKFEALNTPHPPQKARRPLPQGER